MTTRIQHEDVLSIVPTPASGAASEAVLEGEIDGLRTICHALAPGATVSVASSNEEGRVFLFVEGRGTVQAAGQAHEITELAFYAPQHDADIIVRAATSLRLLELIIDLSATDRQELRDAAGAYPLFLSYADCPTYRERIKSEKTVSRTLLAQHTFPRLCIGSVETTGDDEVAAHEHPMLEQLFFGLADNRCTVTADDARFDFGEGVLLHIPLGSSHGVQVKAPDRLHYIWIDLFRDRQGMDWITQEHIPNP